MNSLPTPSRNKQGACISNTDHIQLVSLHKKARDIFSISVSPPSLLLPQPPSLSFSLSPRPSLSLSLPTLKLSPSLSLPFSLSPLPLLSLSPSLALLCLPS